MSKLTAKGQHTGISGTITAKGAVAAVGETVVAYNISNITISDFDATSPIDIGAYYKIDADGDAYTQTINFGSGYNPVFGDADYVRPTSAAGSGLHVRMTKQSGTTVVGPTGWVDTSIDRVWYLARTIEGNWSAEYLCELSDDGGTTVVESGTISFSIQGSGF